jgi:hypothetical protein
MFFDSKNGIQNNQDNLSKSLSKISPNDSNEDKNQISLSESNDIFNYPSPKKMLSEMTQLSKRMRKQEYENEFSNKTKAVELRTKYIPTFRSFINESIYKKLSYGPSPIKEKINIRLKNINSNKITLNRNKIIDKKILKPNLNLISINNTEKFEDINDNKKVIVFDFTSKQNFFSDLLKEDCNFVDNIEQISKKDLLKINNEKEKVIILLDKNREIMNIMRKIEENYKKLKNEYIDLYKNINNISLSNSSPVNINNEYENYITKENINLKKKLDNFNNIFLSMTNYINDISNLFNIQKIDYIEIKKNIIQSNPSTDITNESIVAIFNENIKLISQMLKDKFSNQNNLKFNMKLFGKKGINKNKYK